MSSKKRHIRVRGVRREQPDIRRLARAIIELAQAQAEAEAQAEHQQPSPRRQRDDHDDSSDHDIKTDNATSLPPEDRR